LPRIGHLILNLLSDIELGESLFAALEGQGADFTRLFRALAQAADCNFDAIAAELTNRDAFLPWFQNWQTRLASEPLDPAERATRMEAVNPLYIPRNHRVDAALGAAEAGDMAPFLALLEAVSHPFAERDEWAEFALAPAADAPHFVTYCGT